MASKNNSDYVKTSISLKPIAKQNMSYLALAKKVDVSDLYIDAVNEYLLKNGLNPEEPPKFIFPNKKTTE